MKIEKNIPVTLPAIGRHAKYPFAKMEVGDSVYIECKARGVHVTGERARVAAAVYGLRTGKKFIYRKEKTGVRIWRIDPVLPVETK